MKNGIILVFTLLFIDFLFPLDVVVAEPETDIIYLHESVGRTIVHDNIYILEDKDNSWDINDVRSEPVANQFQKSKARIPNFGYTKSAYWVSFVVNNQSDVVERFFEIGYPALHAIDVYIFDENGLKEKTLFGSKYPYAEREFPHPNFIHVFNIEKDETLTFYIRFESRTSMQMPLYLYDKNEFIKGRQQEFLLSGITYGILTVMALYNLFIFFALRHISYLFYVLVIFATFFSNLSFTGVAYQYLWPTMPKWNEISVTFFLAAGTIFALGFAYTFLEIKTQLPKYKFAYQIFIFASVIVQILLVIWFDIALYVLVFWILATFVLILLTAFLSLRQGLRQARFFLLAWTIFLCGVVLTVLSDAAIIPLNIFTKYSGQLAATIEVVLLSLALADRINILQEEKNKAVQQLYMNQKIVNESLTRADQLKDEFLAMTSHELKTPLNGIVGIAEALQEGAAGKLSSEVSDHLSLIILSGKRLFNVINDLLDYSKLKNEDLQLELKPVNLKDIVDIVLLTCTPLILDKQIELHNRITRTAPYVHADENRVQQILFNLIGNAIKYTDIGEVIISVEANNTHMKISVLDTGRGIPEQELPYIFDQFHQVQFDENEVVGGTGIGLSITKKLVELHGGEISVQSKVGKGTEFQFTLLKSKEKLLTKETAASLTPPMHSDIPRLMPTIKNVESREQPATILIADDELVNLQVLLHQLTLDGYHVIYGINGEEVLEIVKEQEIDLIILDIMMPKLSGYEVCSQLRKSYSLVELPILMLTAKDQLHDKVLSFEVGANDYLTKPCDRKELLSRVKTLVELRKLNKQLQKFNNLLEKKVKERTLELQASNQRLTTVLKSRRQLLENISHELGTPVTVIHSYIQAVQAGLIPANEKKYLQFVFDKVALLTRLIDDLASLSKFEAGQLRFAKQHTILNDWIMEINEKCKLEVTRANRKYESIVEESSAFSMFTCNIDKDRMEQVFTNLVWNAIKHTNEQDGVISMQSNLSADETKVLFAIKDNGYGIDTDELPYIFNRFYKGVNNQPKGMKTSGTGLGLTIVKQIVTAHAGNVWVESEINNGATFYLSFPITKR